jgi:hypothetical protein
MPGATTPARLSYTLAVNLILIMLLAGCASMGATVLDDRWSPMKSIVVVGFIPVLSPGDDSAVVRGPLLGAVYNAQPVSQETSDKMTEVLFSAVESKGYELISPGQAKGVLASLLSTNSSAEGGQLYQQVGKALSADGVLIGYLYRWEERQGADFAVNAPASVAFDLFLLKSEDGVVAWRGKFDKTQQSFFENVLDLDTFVKSKARWMRAEALAEMGLKELMDKFPHGSSQPQPAEE